MKSNRCDDPWCQQKRYQSRALVGQTNATVRGVPRNEAKMTLPSNGINLTTACDDIECMRNMLAKLPRKTRRVLDLLIAGYPNKVIAWQLHMPETTVKTHLSLVFRTLGCANRTQASLIAFCIVHDLPAPLAILTKELARAMAEPPRKRTEFRQEDQALTQQVSASAVVQKAST